MRSAKIRGASNLLPPADKRDASRECCPYPTQHQRHKETPAGSGGASQLLVSTCPADRRRSCVAGRSAQILWQCTPRRDWRHFFPFCVLPTCLMQGKRCVRVVGRRWARSVAPAAVQVPRQIRPKVTARKARRGEVV